MRLALGGSSDSFSSFHFRPQQKGHLRSDTVYLVAVRNGNTIFDPSDVFLDPQWVRFGDTFLTENVRNLSEGFTTTETVRKILCLMRKALCSQPPPLPLHTSWITEQSRIGL